MSHIRYKLLVWFLLATAPVWVLPLSGLLAFSSSHLVSEIGLLLSQLDSAGLFGIFAAQVVLISSPILLFFKRYRRYAKLSLVLAAIFLSCELLGLYWSSVGQEKRIEKVAERGQTILDAIKAYETKNGHPPGSLNELVPDYLEAIPTTGIGAWPEFVYDTGHPRRHYGNVYTVGSAPITVAFQTANRTGSESLLRPVRLNEQCQHLAVLSPVDRSENHTA